MAKIVPAAREDLMAVSLMPDIPYQLVVRCVEHVMQGNGKLYYTQAGGKMAAMHAHHIDDILPQFVAELIELVTSQTFQVIGGTDLAQQRTGGDVHRCPFKG